MFWDTVAGLQWPRRGPCRSSIRSGAAVEDPAIGAPPDGRTGGHVVASSVDLASHRWHCSHMATLWDRIPTWADWVLSLIVAIVVFNLNVTEQGDPLSGVGLSAGPTSAGITEGARATFYGSLAVGGVLLAAAGLIIAMSHRGAQSVGKLLSRTYGGVALAGLAGLLLDYRDGPVRIVQLVVYLMLFLGIVRFARIAVLVSDGVGNQQRSAVR